MKIKFLNIVIVLFFARSLNAYPQINCTTDPPLPPVLTNVTVQYETGRTKISWALSPSSGIAAYIIYTYKSGDGMPVDTVWDPLATTRVIPGLSSKYFSVSYVVSAMRLPRCTSPFSNVISSIYSEAIVDTCNKRILIHWNSYPSIPQKVTGYSIMESTAGGNFTDIAVVGSSGNDFILNDFKINSDYCFVVRANLQDGTFSTSNKACVSTRMKRPPAWINADYATVTNENAISLSFTIDPQSEIKNFRLERKRASSDQFLVIAQVESVNGSVLFTDDKAPTDSVNIYRLLAVNNCSNPVAVSNIASNIVLSLEKDENWIKLAWNSYTKWVGKISGYTIFMNTGNGFEEMVLLLPSDTIYSLNYKDIMYNVSGKEICFYLDAIEDSNPYGIAGKSHSQAICTTPEEIITIPNIFTPDNDLVNDLFRPVLSFTPNNYHLVITNRQGNVIFESADFNESWDGSMKGIRQPQDVYLWFLKVTTPSGNSISRTGTVTVF